VTVIADCLPQVTFDLVSTDRRGLYHLYVSVNHGGYDCVNDGVLVTVIDGSAARGRSAEIVRGRGCNADLETADFLDSDQMGGIVGLVRLSDDGWMTCIDRPAVNGALWTANVAAPFQANAFESPLVGHRGHLSTVQHQNDCC